LRVFFCGGAWKNIVRIDGLLARNCLGSSERMLDCGIILAERTLNSRIRAKTLRPKSQHPVAEASIVTRPTAEAKNLVSMPI